MLRCDPARLRVPDQVTEKIIGSPGGATGSEPTAGRLAFFSNRHAGGGAVNVESTKSPEDHSD